MELKLVPVRVDDPLLNDVIQLGDANKKTLGFLPWAGFVQAAERGGILAAVDPDGVLAGYCLYDLPGSYVRITHMCIKGDFRGRDIARTLIDAVSVQHRNRLGVRLKCRPDWPANKMWPKLGFAQTAQVIGRSKARHPLTIWWLSHGHDDLLSFLLEQNHGRRVAVDANVYSDIYARTKRGGAHHSAALTSLVADQQIKLVVCASVRAELVATTNNKLRERFLAALVHHEQAPNLGQAGQVIADDLVVSLPDGELEKDPSLEPDAAFISEAICADVDVAVSRDDNAVIQYADYVLEKYGLTLVNPSEIRSVLHASEAPGEYLPDQLRNTGYTTGRPHASQWRGDNMAVFLDRAGGERRVDFVELLRTTAAESTYSCDRWLVSAPDGQARAAWVTRVDGTVLQVPLLRVAADNLGATIARLLSFHLRQVAIEAGCATVEIIDQHLPPTVLIELQADGYTQSAGTWTAHVTAAIGPWTDFTAASGITPGLLPPTDEVAEIERVRWPIRLLGAKIPNYLVPIRGTRAADLIGYPVTLDARPDFLGLSREHVYYKAAGGINLHAPGRILWFASLSPQEIIGCSRLIETVTGSPGNLHKLYAKYGVYNAGDVRRAADKRTGQVEVLRFADTELFESPVNLDHVGRLVATHSKRPKLVLRSASAIDDELFTMIYREGTGR